MCGSLLSFKPAGKVVAGQLTLTCLEILWPQILSAWKNLELLHDQPGAGHLPTVVSTHQLTTLPPSPLLTLKHKAGQIFHQQNGFISEPQRLATRTCHHSRPHASPLKQRRERPVGRGRGSWGKLQRVVLINSGCRAWERPLLASLLYFKWGFCSLMFYNPGKESEITKD